MKILTMPSFGADMAMGSIVKWNVKPGDQVAKGDIIASIETMKGLIDMEVFNDGTIVALIAREGDEVEVGRPIAELQVSNEEYSDNKTEETLLSENSQNVEVNPSSSTDKIQVCEAPAGQTLNNKTSLETTDSLNNNTHEQHTQHPKISPAAKTKAIHLGIDWRLLPKGTGPDGALLLNDINIAKKKLTKPASVQVKDPNETMREAIAATVSQSKRDIPHYYLQSNIVLDNALKWLSIHNADLDPNKRILITAVIFSAIARALSTFDAFNGFYRNGHYEPYDSVHLGNAISLRQGGLMVAAIHDAQRLGVVELMDKITDQVTRARKGGLRMSEMQDATVTVSNLGDRGTDSIQSIIFPPQVAIFGIGRPRVMPWVVDNKISCATIVSISLAADHRVSDGHSGARLLNKINKLLQTPEKLI